jgi:hypothetical protein
VLRFVHCRPLSSPRFSPVRGDIQETSTTGGRRRHSSEDSPTTVSTVPGVIPVLVPAHNLTASVPADAWETVTWEWHRRPNDRTLLCVASAAADASRRPLAEPLRRSQCRSILSWPGCLHPPRRIRVPSIAATNRPLRPTQRSPLVLGGEAPPANEPQRAGLGPRKTLCLRY